MTTLGIANMLMAFSAADQAASGARVGDWMQTFTGRQFWPLDPRVDEIDIDDIAHSLSMQCRYAGHCEEFYSVAEHSVLMAGWFLQQGDTNSALWALLHDAPEAYLVDVPRPVKRSLEGYAAIEDWLMFFVAQRFGLIPAGTSPALLTIPAQIKAADNRILVDEYDRLMKKTAPWGLAGPPLGVEIQCWQPRMARTAFLATFRLLTGN